MEKYDIIFYSESRLQYEIVDKLLKKFKNNKCLIITNDFFEFSNKNENHLILRSKVDLHGYKKLITSLDKIELITGRKYQCDIFIASFLTGINSLFWISKIKYNHLHLIDDGTGTLYNLHFKRKFISIRLSHIVFFVNFFKVIFLAPLIKYNNNNIIKHIDHYYSIYEIPNLQFSTERIQLFDEQYVAPIKLEKIAFIGQSLVKGKYIKKEELFALLKRIQNNEQCDIEYFLHPYEENYSNIDSVKFTRLKYGIENHLLKYRYKKVITIYSSSILNLQVNLQDQEIIDSLYFLRVNFTNKSLNNYFIIFENLKIKEYQL